MNLLVQYEYSKPIWNDYEKLKEEINKVAVKRNQLQKDLSISQYNFETLKIKIKDLEMEFNAYEELGKGLTARIIELEEGRKK